MGSRGEKKPRLLVSIASIASKLKLSLAGHSVDEKVEGAEDSSESDLLRLRSILTIGDGVLRIEMIERPVGQLVFQRSMLRIE